MSYDVCIGYQAGYILGNNGTDRIAIGNNAGKYIDGAYSIAIGTQALFGSGSTVNNQYNTAIGYRSQYSSTTGDFNNSVGASSLYNVASGSSNSAFGDNAGYAITTGNSNSAFGSGALYSNTTASYNNAFGANALSACTTGYGNSAFGYNVLTASTTGSVNSAFGREALSACTTGFGNQALGYLTGQSITTGYYNVCIGYNNAATLTTGYGNILIGEGVDSSSSGVTKEIVIAFELLGKGSNTAFIGGTSGAYNGANSATWSVTSDARIKKNIVNLNDGLSVITALRPVEFDYKENDKHEVGFIAQEYETVLPDQIIKHAANKAEKEMVGGDEVFGIQQNLVPYLVKALQELNAKFDAYVATHP